MKELKENKIHPRDVKKALANKAVMKVAHGFYRLADIQFFGNVNISFLTVCRVEHKAVIALASALDYYGLTTFQPAAIHFSIPRSERRKKIFTPPVKSYAFRERQYREGIETIKTGFGDIRIYSIEKTVCDMFRFRNKLGDDLAIEGLKEYLRMRESNIHKLLFYADICGVRKMIFPLIQGVLV